ncbi:hypothetical protein SELSPUOL_02029 [Selenomonas sputigena ATCC 35185]|uniref:Uncharacterized protein n=1 Tax=Selenomonas sputigena (strain ATCC 35185 / DSM 20758 / CCUG 44933 / VPI D19B-28) TaxID=546271 RepID=C9LX23_SELS3|nr:hypothetical protein SELSPUOL_02029 [Selenomonas sputigena ATCC 35185]
MFDKKEKPCYSMNYRKTSWRRKNGAGFPIFLESPQALLYKTWRGYYILAGYVITAEKVRSHVRLRGGFPKP